jgi:MFS family permease
MNLNVSQDLTINLQNMKPKLWSMDYINTLIVNLIINISSMILITVLPLFTMTIGGNNFIAGLLTTLLTLSALIFRPFFGKMLDNRGRRKVLILGLSLFSLSSILLLAATNMHLLLLLRLFQGVGLSAYSTALGTIVSDIVPSQRISEGVGYFGISATISMAIGPTFGLYIYDKFGYQVTYIITFVITLSSVIFAYLINYERNRKNSIDKNQKNMTADRKTVVLPQKNQGKSFIEKSSIRPCVVMFFIVFAISAVFSFMPIFGKARDIDNIGLFFTFYAVSMILSRLVTGKIADRYGFFKAFLPGIAITFMLFLTLIFAHSLPVVLLAAVFYGVGFGTVQPIMNAIVIKLSSPERRGAANATYYATMDIGFGLGSFVWGVVSQIVGFTAVFLGCALSIVISVLVYFIILHRLLRKNGL